MAETEQLVPGNTAWFCDYVSKMSPPDSCRVYGAHVPEDDERWMVARRRELVLVLLHVAGSKEFCVAEFRNGRWEYTATVDLEHAEQAELLRLLRKAVRNENMPLAEALAREIERESGGSLQ